MKHPCLDTSAVCDKQCIFLEKTDQKSLCVVMLKTLRRVGYNMLASLDEEEKDDILSDTIEGIKKSIAKDEKKKFEKFAHYVTKALSFKRADYYRKISKKISSFKKNDIRDIDSLISNIINTTDKITGYIYAQWLGRDTKYYIGNHSENDEDDGDMKALRKCLLRDFNKILDDKTFFKEDAQLVKILPDGRMVLILGDEASSEEDALIPAEIVSIIKKEKKTQMNIKKLNKWILMQIFPSLSSDWAGTVIEVPLDDHIPFLYAESDTLDSIDARKILSVLESLAKNNDASENSCAKRVLFWFNSLSNGNSQKKMAEQYGEKENTFNQYLKRCFDKIRTHLGIEKDDN